MRRLTQIAVVSGEKGDVLFGLDDEGQVWWSLPFGEDEKSRSWTRYDRFEEDERKQSEVPDDVALRATKVWRNGDPNEDAG